MADKPFVAIQVGAVSFVDEGVGNVLDIFVEKAKVNALLLATHTFDRGTGGRQIPGTWCTGVTDPAVLARLDEVVRHRVLQVDLKGRGIADYGEMSILAPMFEVFWDGRDNAGERVNSGTYFYQLETPGFRSAKKAVVLQ